MDLVPILEDLGIEGIRDAGKEITAKCPAHEARTGKPDSHPSWSINRETGAHICFSCGWSGGLTALFVEQGELPPDDLVMDLKTTSVRSKVAKVQEEISPKFEPAQDFPWTETRLKSLYEIPDGLLKLKYLTHEACHTFGVKWDRKQKAWVFPIRWPDGTLMAVQLRKKGWERNWPKEAPKSETLFGLSTVSAAPMVAVVESPMDAVRLFVAGIPAVATMGAAVSSVQMDLLARHFVQVGLWFDNDKAGKEATDIVSRGLRKRMTPVRKISYEGLCGSKDPGEVADDHRLEQAWDKAMKFKR